jgi:dephospho-CoA kinase
VVRVALTGGIASGKSRVLSAFAAVGVPTVDGDLLARHAIAPGTPGEAAVRARFGEAAVDAEGALDRRALAAIVFGDPAARRDLEAIVHPGVYRGIEGWFAKLPADTTLAVADIPLLFETGREKAFDAVVVAACSPDEQLRRVMARDGLTEAEARARLDAQWPLVEKISRADFVVWTTGTFEETAGQVDQIIQAIAGPQGR